MDAGETARARAEYVRVIMKEPDPSCAIAALKPLNTPAKPASCADADAMLERGNGDAKAAYVKLGPDTKCATEGLAVLRDCAAGAANEAAHHHADAIKAYKAALDKNPDARCATQGIRQSRTEAISDAATTTVSWVKSLALAAGIAVVAVFVISLLGYWKWFRRYVLFPLPVVGRILGPRVTIASFEGPLPTGEDGKPSILGAAMAAQIKERLHAQRDALREVDRADYDLDYGGSDELIASIVSDDRGVRNALSKAKDISEQAGMVAAVLELLYALLPIFRINASAVLDPPEVQRAGGTFSLEADGRMSGAVHLVGPSLDKDANVGDYMKLVDPAAVWLQYELARALSGDDGRNLPAAESFALVREGLALQRDGDLALARRAYERALEQDDRNWPARVNLAIIEARLAKDYKRSVTLLRDARRDFKQAAYDGR